jgi:hypothetical protein
VTLDLEHVVRPTLPWRGTEDLLTECGLPADADRNVISREDLRRKWKEQGQTRASMTTCMTCLHTAHRWPSWDEDPVRCLGREMGYYGNPRFEKELRAIQLLIEAHSEEFSNALGALDDAASFNEARMKRLRKRD